MKLQFIILLVALSLNKTVDANKDTQIATLALTGIAGAVIAGGVIATARDKSLDEKRQIIESSGNTNYRGEQTGGVDSNDRGKAYAADLHYVPSTSAAARPRMPTSNPPSYKSRDEGYGSDIDEFGAAASHNLQTPKDEGYSSYDDKLSAQAHGALPVPDCSPDNLKYIDYQVTELGRALTAYKLVITPQSGLFQKNHARKIRFWLLEHGKNLITRPRGSQADEAWIRTIYSRLNVLLRLLYDAFQGKMKYRNWRPASLTKHQDSFIALLRGIACLLRYITEDIGVGKVSENELRSIVLADPIQWTIVVNYQKWLLANKKRSMSSHDDLNRIVKNYVQNFVYDVPAPTILRLNEAKEWIMD